MDDGDDFSPMVEIWDSIQTIRNRFRKGEPLVAGDNPDIKSTVTNKAVLMPVLEWMAARPGHPLPPVEEIRSAVRAIYMLNKVQTNPPQVSHDGWLLRKYLGFIKMKVRRSEVSVESWTIQCMLLTIAYCLLDETFAQDPDFQDMVLVLAPELQDWS